MDDQSRFVVDDFLNAIKVRTVGRIAKDDEWRRRWGSSYKPVITFDTELEATKFVFDRAEEQLEKARKSFGQATKQVKKWRNLYAVRLLMMQSPTSSPTSEREKK